MVEIWQNLSVHIQRLFIVIVVLTGIMLVSMQFHVNPQGNTPDTYPKVFRGGTCAIESDTLLVGHSAYLFPEMTQYQKMRWARHVYPRFVRQSTGPGLLSITVNLPYPVSIREQPVAVRLTNVFTMCSSDLLLQPQTAGWLVSFPGYYICISSRSSVKLSVFTPSIRIDY